MVSDTQLQHNVQAELEWVPAIGAAMCARGLSATKLKKRPGKRQAFPRSKVY